MTSPLDSTQVTAWLRENGWAILADAVEFGERMKLDTKQGGHVATNVGPLRGEWVRGLGEPHFVKCRDCDRPNLCAIMRNQTQPCWQPAVKE